MVRRVSRRNYRSKRVKSRGSRSLRKRVKSRRTRSLRSRRSLRRRRMRGGARFKVGDIVTPLMSGDAVKGLRKGDVCTIITVYKRYKQDGIKYQPYGVKKNNTDVVYQVNEEFLTLMDPSVNAQAGDSALFASTPHSMRDDEEDPFYTQTKGMTRVSDIAKSAYGTERPSFVHTAI